MKSGLVVLAPIFAVALNSCAVDPSPSTPSSQPAASAAQEAANLEVPELRTKPNGDIEVVFTEKGCVVIFDRDGNLRMGGRGCDDVDLHRAKEAVRAHLAEQNADFLDV